jgi:hypothetical protein
MGMSTPTRLAFVARQKFFAYNVLVPADCKGIHPALAGSTNRRSDFQRQGQVPRHDGCRTPGGLSPGRDDIGLATEDRRTCIIRHIDLTNGNYFTTREAELADSRDVDGGPSG